MTLQFGTAWGLDSGSDGGDWRPRGACADPQWDPNLWTSSSAEDRGQAVWLCRRRCDVRAQCFAWASDHRRQVRGGVYGGYWWTSRLESRPAHPANVAERRPVAVPALDTAEPAHGPRTDAERIAWMWAAGVPLETIAERVGCERMTVAEVVGGLRKAPGSPPPRPTAECGSRSGRERHKRLGEPICDRCLAAEAAYRQGWRARRRAAA